MKGLQATRITLKIGDVWESPLLHVLVTREDDVVVARCLDFTVSSHGEDAQNALNALGEAIKEYVLTAVENDALDTLSDPASGKYWRMFNELEMNQSLNTLKQSFKQATSALSPEYLQQSSPQICYA